MGSRPSDGPQEGWHGQGVPILPGAEVPLTRYWPTAAGWVMPSSSIARWDIADAQRRSTWLPASTRYRSQRRISSRRRFAHNAIVCRRRVMRAIYEHKGDTFDNALSFVLRAASKDTGLIPDLQDADPVCIRLQALGNVRRRLITVPFMLIIECSGECLTA